jgi:hypothetical protein
MAECCKDFRYQFTQFKVVYERAKAQRTPAAAATSVGDVQYAQLDMYQQAFLERSGDV